MHEVHAPALAKSRWLWHGATMQTHVLAAANPHPELQTFEPIQTTNPLLVHRPALPTEHDVNTLVAEPRPGVGNLPDPQPQCRLILRLGPPVEGSSRELGQVTGLACARLEPLLDPADQRTAPGRLQSFFRTTSPRMCLSRVRSATTRLRRAFSSRSCSSSRSAVFRGALPLRRDGPCRVHPGHGRGTPPPQLHPSPPRRQRSRQPADEPCHGAAGRHRRTRSTSRSGS